MKLPLHWLTIGLMALSLGITGCRKRPDRLTTLGGTGPRSIVGDEPSNPFGTKPFEGGTTTTATPTETGLPQPPGDWDNPAKWTRNPDMFRDQTVYFDFDKATVKPSEVAKLTEVARRMRTMPGHALKIEGHADERGTEEYNRTLGDKRAQSIREFLFKEGMNPDMMPTITFGEDKPAVAGHNEAAWAKNRRGELVLLVPVR